MISVIVEGFFAMLFTAASVYAMAMTIFNGNYKLGMVYLIALLGNTLIDVVRAIRKMAAQRAIMLAFKAAIKSSSKDNERGGNA